MKQQELQSKLQALLSKHAGMRGCALVEANSGLVWSQAGAATVPGLWEASVEFWRIRGRLARHFEPLGELGAVITHQGDSILATLPCLMQPDVLLISLANRGEVNWRVWQRDALVLADVLRRTL